MGFIRERKLKGGGVRYQAEIRLKGHPMLTAGFDRKTDAKSWIQKVEADIRCGRHQLYTEGKKHTFSEAVAKYKKEQPISVAKSGHLETTTPPCKGLTKPCRNPSGPSTRFGRTPTSMRRPKRK